MKSIIAFAVSAVLLMGTCLPGSPADASSPNHGARGSERRVDDDHGLAGRFITEVRSGEAVALRAAQLRTKNKYLAKAMKALEKRGLKPAFEERGVSILAIDKEGAFKKASFRKTSTQTIVDGDYEMTFLPYENGNDATWEGLIYFRGGGNDDVDYALFDISESEDVSTISEYNYSDDGGEGSGCGDVECDVPEDEEDPPTTNYKKGSSTHIKRVSHTLGAPAVAQIGARLGLWVFCFIRNCAIGASRCRMTGPYWAQCTAGWCGVAAIRCAISTL